MTKTRRRSELPELICIQKPHKNCNDGYYKVIIPYSFIPRGVHFMGLSMEFRFIGLKFKLPAKERKK